MAKRTIGFIGLGIMGRPMALNLIKAGFPLVVHDRVQSGVDALVAAGAAAAQSSKEVAERSDVIITMLPDSPDVEAAVMGPSGVLEGMRPGKTLIDMSTISPVTTLKVAEKIAEIGAAVLDAPVSGGDIGAREASLSIMVGGAKATFDACLDILQAMGKKIVLVGENGAGQTVKACNQIVVALTYTAVAEALVLGAKAGVDPAKIVEVLAGGLAGSRILDVRGPKILRRDFAPGFRSRLHYKDLGIALAAGKAYSVPLPATALAHELYGAMLAAGRQDLDHSAVITIIEDLAHTQVKGS